MKWVLSLFLGMLFIGIAAGALLFLNLNAEDVRPHLQHSLDEILGMKTNFGSLNLKFKGIHPALEIENLELVKPGSREPILKAARAQALIQWTPLLRQNVVLSYLEFEKPSLVISRNENLEWNWFSASVSLEKSTEKKHSAKKAWAVSILALGAKEASLYYADRSQAPYFHQQFKNLQIKASRTEDRAGYLIHVQPQGSPVKSVIRTQAARTLDIQISEDPRLLLTMQVNDPLQEARVSGHLNLNQYYIRIANASAAKGRLGFEGTLTGSFEFSGAGLQPELWKRFLVVKGSVSIENGMLLGVPMVRDLLDEMAPLPGFVNLTRQTFPEEYEELYDAEDMSFKSMTGNLQAAKGKAFLNEVQFRHEHYTMELEGSWDMIQDRVTGKGSMMFKGPFARFLEHRVRDMEVLQGPQGDLAVPYDLQGKSDNVLIRPNLFFIANRLIQMRSEELAARGVQRINEFLEAQQQ